MKRADYALIDRETTEISSIYPDEKYGLTGFTVDVVGKSELINGRKITSGDILLGLLFLDTHSKDYLLVRKISR